MSFNQSQLETSGTTESTFYGDLMMNLDNDRMTDFVLLSLDGERVLASKFILGARSPVFRRQLFSGKGSQRPGNQNMLEIGYSGTVVQAMVEYCRSDDIRNFTGRVRYEHTVRELVHLFECAEFYQLQGLLQKVCATATKICQTSKHLAPAIFDQACQSKALQISQIGLAAIQEEPQAALLNSALEELDFGVPTSPPGVSYLSIEALSQILRDKKMCCDEIVMFQILVAWLNMHERSKDLAYWAKHDPDLEDVHTESPKEIARQLVQHIDLTMIAPSELLTTVAKSELVSNEKITAALAEIAQLVEKHGGFDLNQPRRKSGSGAPIYERRSTLFPKDQRRNRKLQAAQPQKARDRHHSVEGHTPSASRRSQKVSAFTLEDDLSQGILGINELSFGDEANNSICGEDEATKQRSKSNASKSKSPTHEPESKKKEGFVRKSVLLCADGADAICASACASNS